MSFTFDKIMIDMPDFFTFVGICSSETEPI